MFIKSAKYTGSYPDVGKMPASTMPEYAFIGRSNVGKSSLINYLTGQTKLAKISGTPGKTQTINTFLINEEWNLADLPGYGYAKISRTQREKWGKMIRNYLLKRPSLCCVFLLIDSRIPPQKIDLEFISWLGEQSIPFVLIFTKADKHNAPKIQQNIKNFKNTLQKTWLKLPDSFITSAAQKLGAEDILGFIEQTNRQIQPKEG